MPHHLIISHSSSLYGVLEFYGDKNINIVCIDILYSYLYFVFIS